MNVVSSSPVTQRDRQWHDNDRCDWHRSPSRQSYQYSRYGRHDDHTMMTQTDTDAVLVLPYRETEMQVHTLEAVFASRLLKDIHTLLAAVKGQTSATVSQPQNDFPKLMPDKNDSQPHDSVSSTILAIVEGIEVCTLTDSVN